MLLERLSRWCYSHRWRVLIAWIVALVGIGAVGNAFAADAVDDFALPGTDSQDAYDALAAQFPEQSGDSARLVFHVAPSVGTGFDDAGVRSEVEAVLADAARLDHVVGVESPYDARQQVSDDGTIAFANVLFDERASEIGLETGKDYVKLGDADSDTLTVEAGGPLAEFAETSQPGASEGIGLLAAVIILLVAFGSLLAMGLPILNALFGIGIGLALVSLLGHLLPVPSFAPQVASMIGIGVGIDYALFIVTRYRSSLSHGSEPLDAVVEAMTTAGRAVVFAGSVVVLALLGMLVMDFTVVRGVSLAGASVVLVIMLASMTLMPALLGFVGRGIDRFKTPFVRKAGGGVGRDSLWFKWSRLVQRRPWPVALAGLAVLVALTLPLFSMRLGASDAGNASKEKSNRRAYDLLAEGFGPGFNGPFLVVVEDAADASAESPNGVAGALQRTEGVAFVAPPQFNEAGDTAIIPVFADAAPQDARTDDVVLRIRNEVIPKVGGDDKVHVGGLSASFVDFGDKIGERLPFFIGIVIALAFLLLTAVFRSPLVSLKAAILNLLSISAAYGVIVAVFQWGWGADFFGVGQKGPIEAWVPMMMFATLFGLSMDYEVFLISRIREEYLKTRDNALAVADGLAATARVITAAAAIMIAVFLSFVLGDERVLKLMGLGLATAIFVDATVVRMVLVPSTMEILGDRNWWVPKWLDKLLPHFEVEAPHASSPVQESESDSDLASVS